MADGIVIVGASHAGVLLAHKVRQFGFTSNITLINGERHLPYHRPPLSKIRLGEVEGTSMLLPLRPREFFKNSRINVIQGVQCATVDRRKKRVHLLDGLSLGYDVLVLATGGTPRLLPQQRNHPNPNILSLRTLDDAQGLRRKAMSARNVVIVGAGFIGLELAATLKSGARNVTVVENGNRILTKSASQQMASFIYKKHVDKGVRFALNSTIAEFIEEGGTLRGVRLTNKEIVPADLIVVGVGIAPAIELAKSAGLKCEDGIIVDENCVTSDPYVFAVGDCALRPTPYAIDDRARLESIHSATEQARRAAAQICGVKQAEDACPWFWSDQWDMKLQRVGLLNGNDHTIMRSIDGESMALYHFTNGKLTALETVNRPGEHLAVRRIFNTGILPSPKEVARCDFDPVRYISAGTNGTVR